MKTRMIIIIAPSGAGKSSFIERAIRDFPNLFDTITYTTREMRKGEKQGEPYYFTSVEEFKEKREAGYFVEWAEVHGNLYGTPRHQIEDAWKSGLTVIMDVDVQGADTFCRVFPDARTIFIMPPSIEELRNRIIKRDKQAPANLETRLKNAEREMQRAKDFDFCVVNDDFEVSYQKFRKIIEDLLGSK